MFEHYRAVLKTYVFHMQNIFYLFWFLIIYFNWRIITLQYCDGFYHASVCPDWKRSENFTVC